MKIVELFAQIEKSDRLFLKKTTEAQTKSLNVLANKTTLDKS